MVESDEFRGISKTCREKYGGVCDSVLGEGACCAQHLQKYNMPEAESMNMCYVRPMAAVFIVFHRKICFVRLHAMCYSVSLSEFII